MKVELLPNDANGRELEEQYFRIIHEISRYRCANEIISNWKRELMENQWFRVAPITWDRLINVFDRIWRVRVLHQRTVLGKQSRGH